MHYRSARIFVSLLLASVLLACTAVAQTTASETPAARQLTAWLNAFNSGDPDTLQRFFRDQFPARAGKDVAPDLDFRARTGGLELVKLEESTQTRAVALVKERDSESAGARLIVEVEPAAPHRILRADLQPGAAIPVNIPRLNRPALIKAIRAELDKRAAADRFSGTVLVAKNGVPFFTGAYGLADRERGLANKLDTRLRIGSMNKMFTAVAVMTLAQAGKLAVSDPIGKYLTDYPNQTLASKVTIHHLLTHTGGTGDVFGPDFMAHRDELRTTQDYVKRYGARDLLFEPGSRFDYSNYGFILLGAIIEKVSGQSYHDYVRDHLYKPAGMTSTGSEPEKDAPANLAIGYTKGPGKSGWSSAADLLPHRGTSAGGGYTTVEDLMRFSNALLKHKLLNAQLTELLTTGKISAMGGKYAYGVIERVRTDGVRTIGHGGFMQGMSADLVMFPDSGYVVAVLANIDPPAAQRVADFITNRLPER